MKIKFINATILTLNNKNEIISNGEVVIDGNVIIYVGKHSKLIADNIIDLKGKILMPGFINTHCHNAMSLFRGIGEGANFGDWWYNYIRPIEIKITGEDVYTGTKLSIYEMIKAGITTTVDLYMFPEYVAKAINECGIRGYISVGPEFNKHKTYKQIEKEAQEICKIGGNLVKPIAFAHAPYSIDEVEFGELIKYAEKNNIVLSTHVSETLNEVGECHKKTGLTPIGLLESYGFFDHKCLLSHCVQLDKEDISILKNYLNNVSINSNPSSNLYLGSGIAPITAFSKAKINVCLGTDSPASNNSLDMFKEMFLVKNLQSGYLNEPNAISSIETLRMATINGAKALGCSNLGAISESYLADIIVLDNNACNLQPQNNIISNVVNAGNISNVYLTMVNGKILYLDGKYLLKENVADIIKNATKSINSIKR